MRSTDENPYPVSETEQLMVTIIGLGEKKDGIAKVDGFVLVVPGTEKGKRYLVEVTAIRGKVGFAKVIDSIPLPYSAP